MKKFTKIALVVASFVLVAALSVGATIAWLTAETKIVTNTFTSSAAIDITLQEHQYIADTDKLPGTDGVLGSLDMNEEVQDNEYPMVPGVTLPKDPFIKISTDSEPCWVFIEIVEVDNVLDSATGAKYLTYTKGDDWTLIGVGVGPNGGDVYYYKEYLSISDTDTDNDLTSSVLKNGVQVNSSVTEDDNNVPELVFYGYAIQKASMADQTTAWNAYLSDNPID